MADNSFHRKVRKSNFSTDEVDVLVKSVRNHFDVLYGRFAKRATNRWVRQKAWMDILKRVNGVSIEKRTLQEVKNKWKKCQYVLKEKGALKFHMDEGDSSWDDVDRPLASFTAPVSKMRKRNHYTRQMYNAYDLDLKKTVVLYAERNGNKEAQAHYGISEANIRRWRRLKHDLFDRPDYDRSKLRLRKFGSPDLPEAGESQSSIDSMPLQERLSKGALENKSPTNPVLKSQQMSPTKLKVTRQSARILNKPVEPPPSPVNEEMCLRWNSHHSNMQTAFPSILHKEQYVDVTLAAEGKTLKCHRLILSSCSPYFDEILSGISPLQHPVLFMKDIPFWILKSLCDFMYAGEVHIYQNKLEELLTVAEALKIKGLAGKSTPPDKPNEGKSKTSTDKPQQGKKIQTQDDDNEDLLDPLDLLEPLYEEAAEEKKPSSTVTRPKELKYQYQPVKKPFTKKLRKRKYSEQQRDPSPPPVFSFRKGTRSRPNVKIPKYYHSDYSNTTKSTPNSQADPLLDVDEIKTEPIDVEDNLIDYSDDENQFGMELHEHASPIIITSAKPQQQTNNSEPENFKRIRLSKPVITEVHSIDETKTTSGGLEVIKITLPPSREVVEEDKPPPSEDKDDKETEENHVDVEEVVVPDEKDDEEEVVVPDEKDDEEIVVPDEKDDEEAPQVDNNVVEDVQTEPEIVEDQLTIEDVEETETATVEEIQDKEERTRNSSLDHLEKEAMNVANAITLENKAEASLE